MFSRNTTVFRFFFAGMDLFVLNAVHFSVILMMDRIDRSQTAYLAFFLFSSLAWLFSAYANAVYTKSNYTNFEHFAKQSLKAYLTYIVLILVFIFFYN